ncbi:MAG: hypothetical protein Ta2G_09680 [Termitinemataceae bacterium]|nr:MAG: hypothetical protein Ta2G_09680 [Termitinemataceae bacterium]
MADTILAIDTSADFLSVGLALQKQGSPCTFCVELDAGTSHAELLIGAVQAVTDLAGIEPVGIDSFVCMEGPGSFTGLRIGFAAVKALALAFDRPYFAIPTLDCAALPFDCADVPVLAVLDAKQKRFYAAIYYQRKRLTDYLDATPQILLETLRALEAPPSMVIISGNGADLAFKALNDLQTAENGENQSIKLVLDPQFRRGRSALMLKYIQLHDTLAVRNMFSAVPAANPQDGPLYIRRSDAEQNFDKGAR